MKNLWRSGLLSDVFCVEVGDCSYNLRVIADKVNPTHMVSTMRRLDNGDDCTQGRRGYCVEVGGDSMPRIMIVASDGDSGDGDKS